MAGEPTAAQLEAASDFGVLLDRFRGGVIIGGIAVGLLANPRATKDVDGLLMFDIEDLATLLEAASELGFDPLIPDMAGFARQSSLVVLVHRKTGTRADLMLGTTPFEEEVVSRASLHEWRGSSYRLPSPEDLIIMKGIAHRDQDMADIRAIAEVYPNLDRARVEFWLTQYADLLDSPDIWEDVDRLLTRVLPPN